MLLKYTYKIYLTCDASGYNRETKIRCKDCDGKGIKIIPIEKPENKKDEEKD